MAPICALTNLPLIMNNSAATSTGVLRIAGSPRGRLFIQAGVVLGLAVTLRAIHLDKLSLWNDELFSRYYADLFGSKYLWTTGLQHENSPPLYYLALQAWMWLFGDSEVAMRSLSLVASILALPLVFILGTELFDQRRGLIAAALLALSPMQIDLEILERGAHRTLRLRPPFEVGRDKAADVALRDPEVSRRHARFQSEQGVAYLDDLKSRNGTFLNGRRVTEAIEIREGDEIDVGTTRLIVASVRPG